MGDWMMSKATLLGVTIVVQRGLAWAEGTGLQSGSGYIQKDVERKDKT
jgi:hypothetical protein